MVLTRVGRSGALALASLFVAAATIYASAWIYFTGEAPSARIGVEGGYAVEHSAYVIDGAIPGTPADRAGLVRGDMIVAIDGEPMTTRSPLYDRVNRGTPGQRVTLTVRRASGATEDIELVLAEPPPPEPWSLGGIAEELLRLYPLGFLAVMTLLLLQRPQDRNAWLVSLLFASCIAAAPLDPAMGPPVLRGFALGYKMLFTALIPALFYCLFAQFPARSPIDRRLPWLKYGFAAIGLAVGVPLALFVARTGTWDPLLRLARQPAWQPVGMAMVLVGLGSFLLGMASLIWNYRSAPDVTARRRTGVIVWGTIVAVGPTVILHVATGGREPYDIVPFWVWAPTVFALFLLPLAFGYAVVKHRVIEIPLLLKRSARYLLVQRGLILLVVLVGLAASVTLALWFPHVAPHRPALAVPAGLLVGVGFGIALAWAGTHVHRGMAQRIDRAFFRSAYDARRILEDLAVEAARSTTRHELAALLSKCLDDALRPATLAVYLDAENGSLGVVHGETPEALASIPMDDPAVRAVHEHGAPLVVEDPDGGHPLRSLAALAPECVVPIIGRTGALTGLVVLGPRRSDEPYSSEDRRLLESVSRQAGLALENIVLAEHMAARIEAERRTKQELAIAQEVQARLLPQQVPAVATLDFRGACIQARAVGGDYYDFLDLGGGNLALVMADISGKGISAALLMANLQAHLRAQYLVARKDPARLLTTIDRQLFDTTAAHHFATLFFGCYDDAARRLVYANCGHNPPLLLRACGSVSWLQPTAPAVGLLPSWSCTVSEVTLDPGDTLIVYTDGVTEAMDDDAEPFGEERLLELAQQAVHLPIDRLVTTILDEVQRFSGTVQEDDLTLVVARAR